MSLPFDVAMTRVQELMAAKALASLAHYYQSKGMIREEMWAKNNYQHLMSETRAAKIARAAGREK